MKAEIWKVPRSFTTEATVLDFPHQKQHGVGYQPWVLDLMLGPQSVME